MHICSDRLIAFLIVALLVSYVPALYYAIFSSPPDHLHGQYIRIMYVHVPAAWLGLGIYSIMGLLNFLSLVSSHVKFRILAYALAPIGIAFTSICLITGSLWGKPIWGAFWVWDARLTSMLILLMLYIGYYLIWDYKELSMKIAAIVNVVGLMNIPIIKFSVEIWSTLHQKSSIFAPKGIAIASSMILPLILMALSSLLLAILLWYCNTVSILNNRKIYRLLLNEKLING